MKARTQRRRQRVRRRRLRIFRPSIPLIVEGRFKDRRVNDLSDEELQTFLKREAGWQYREAFRPLSGFVVPPTCPDFSQYWCAKYELERRKGEVIPVGITLPEIQTSDDYKHVARRLFDYAYKLAAKRYHPDRGGDNEVMKLIIAARDFVKKQCAW